MVSNESILKGWNTKSTLAEIELRTSDRCDITKHVECANNSASWDGLNKQWNYANFN